MDALSEMLHVVRVTDAVFTLETFPADRGHLCDVTLNVEPDAVHRIVFHMVTEGGCFFEIEGQPTLQAGAGDVVLFPNGRAHQMVAAAGRPPKSPRSGKPQSGLSSTVVQDDYTLTRFVRGHLACDLRLTHTLLASLPPVIRVGIRGSRAGAWLESSITYALGESRAPTPGGAGMLAKLAELLFIEVLRIYFNACDNHHIGWLAGVSDRTISTVLNSLHRQPARAWTLDELARTAGTSRSVLAERFRQLMGTTPMQYLTQWRMLIASNLLRHGNTPLTRIAEHVGYQTDTAFIRAFRRERGMSPAAWRRLDRRRKPRPCATQGASLEGLGHDDAPQEIYMDRALRSRTDTRQSKASRHGLR